MYQKKKLHPFSLLDMLIVKIPWNFIILGNLTFILRNEKIVLHMNRIINKFSFCDPLKTNNKCLNIYGTGHYII